MRLQFDVNGHPVPKQRAQVAVDTRTGKSRAYYKPRPRGSKLLSYPDYKQQIQLAARNAMIESNQWFETPDTVDTWHITVWIYVHGQHKGDVENMAGSVMDALEGLVYKNDRQVGRLFAERVLIPTLETPFLRVGVQTI